MNDRSYKQVAYPAAESSHLKLTYSLLGWVFEVPIIWNIFGSHAKRLGLTRVMFGGFSMYLSLPFFIITHATGLALVIQYGLTPLFRLKRRGLRDYIIIDRYKIAGLTTMDKINCAFCGYANGSIHFLNTWLDDLASAAPRLGLTQKLLAGALLSFYLPFLAVLQTVTLHVVYELLVAAPLGLASMTRIAAQRRLAEMRDYQAEEYSLFMVILRQQKLFSMRMAFALAQIESSWCPLKHLRRGPEVSFPDHHASFFEADQVDEMLSTLVEHGSALKRQR